MKWKVGDEFTLKDPYYDGVSRYRKKSKSCIFVIEVIIDTQIIECKEGWSHSIINMRPLTKLEKALR